MNKTLLWLSISAASTFTVYAESESKTETDDYMEVVVVTASGNEQTLFNSPVTIGTVSSSEAESDKATWIGETVNRVPGVYFQQFRGPVDAPAIRLPVAVDNVYLFLQDNVPLQSPISFNHAAFSYSGALTSFGGMEILKGPGTAIHGSDALAAVVNVKSKAPVFNREGVVSYRTGENNLQDFRADVSGGLNDNHAARLAVSYQSDDGWRDTTGWKRTQVIGRHLYENDGWEIHNILSYTDFDSEMAGSLTPDALANNPTSDGLAAEVNRDDARDLAEYFRLSSQISKTVSETVTLQITPYIRSIDAEYMHTWEPATTPVTSGVTDTLGVLNRVYFDWNDDSSTIVGIDLEWTDYEKQTEQLRPTQVVWGTVYPQGIQLDYEVSYQSYAPYIQHTQALNDKLTLVLGLRYEHSEYGFTNHLSAADFSDDEPSPFFLLDNRDDAFSELLPKASLNYTISEEHNVYARYAKGFRIPDESDLYVLSPSQAEFQLDPETIQSFEVGYRGWLSDAVSINAAIYHMVADGGIVTGVDSPAGDISVNGGEEQYQGIELGLQAQLNKDVLITAALAFTNNTVEQKFSNRVSEFDGLELKGSPSPIANVRVQYTPAIIQNFTANLEIQHIGHAYMDEANTTESDSVTLFNLRAEYALSPAWTFDVKVQNLLDKEHVITADAPSWAPEGRFRPGAPRTASIGVSYAF